MPEFPTTRAIDRADARSRNPGRVAVVGAGPAGIAQLAAIDEAERRFTAARGAQA